MPYRRGRVWWASVQVGGQRVARPAGATRQDALDLEADLRRELREPPARGIEAALRQHIAGLAPAEGAGIRDRRRHRNALERGRALYPHIAGRSLTRADVGEAVRSIVESRGQRAISTVNRTLALLRRVCNLAYRWGWTTEPLGPLVRPLAGESVREVYLSREQVEALAQAMPRCGDACRLAAYTGLRRGELLGLRPEDVHGRALRVAASRSKNGRARTVPLPSQVVEIAAGLPWPWSEMTLRREWNEARRVTGLEHVHWHDLRHTYASWLVSAGVSLYEVQQLLGHTSPTMTQRYAHLAPSRLHGAVSVLEAPATSAATVVRLTR